MLLHDTTRLDGAMLRAIALCAAAAAAAATLALLPRLLAALALLRDQLASLDADDDIDSVLEKFLRWRPFGAIDRDGDGEADDPRWALLANMHL